MSVYVFIGIVYIMPTIGPGVMCNSFGAFEPGGYMSVCVNIGIV